MRIRKNLKNICSNLFFCGLIMFLTNCGGSSSASNGGTNFVITGQNNLINTLNSSNQLSNVGFSQAPIYSSAYGNNKYVEVGDDGVIEVSNDGISWQIESSGTNATLTNIIYGNGKFVAVGGYGINNTSVILTSTNGVNWNLESSGTLEDSVFSQVIYANNIFVAVGRDGVEDIASNALVLTSTDGINWVNTSPESRGAINGVTFGNGKFILVGQDSLGHNGELLVSTDASNWTNVTSSEFVNNILNGATYSENKYVVVGENLTDSNASVLTSEDTLTWQSESSGVLGEFNSIATNGTNLFVAVGQTDSGNSLISQSSDGITWNTISSISESNQNIYNINYVNGTFYSYTGLALESYLSYVFSSSNGTNWTTESFVFSDYNSGVAYNGSMFVIVGGSETNSGGHIMTSMDGVNWSSKSASASLYAVTFGNGKFIAVGDLNTILVSDDNGVNWTTSSSGVDGSSPIQAITFGNNKFVAINNAGQALISVAGASWLAESTNFNGKIYNITYGDGKFVAVGDFESNSVVLVSTNGIDWTVESNILPDSSLRGVTYGNGKFIAVGISLDGQHPPIILSSINGLNWEAEIMPHGIFNDTILEAVSYANGQFVAVGQNGLVLYSLDGDHWTKASLFNGINLTGLIGY